VVSIKANAVFQEDHDKLRRLLSLLFYHSIESSIYYYCFTDYSYSCLTKRPTEVVLLSPMDICRSRCPPTLYNKSYSDRKSDPVTEGL
jgi:hypothetical protein